MGIVKGVDDTDNILCTQEQYISDSKDNISKLEERKTTRDKILKEHFMTTKIKS